MRDETKPLHVLLCEDSLEGILCGVYEAYTSRYGHDNIRLMLNSEEYELEFFAQYQTVAVKQDCASRVLASIQEKIGEEALEQVTYAAYSEQEDKAEVIYRYLIRGFAMGGRVIHHLSDGYVSRMLAISRNTSNEVRRWMEFLRFQIQENGLLTSVIEPKARVLPFVMPHFADRLPIEDFIIYDKTHDVAGVHRRQSGWFLMEHIRRDYPEQAEWLEHSSEEEKIIQGLWKVFFDTIAVEERKNTKLQQQNLPLWCRSHMTEWNQ